jgi:integrase
VRHKRYLLGPNKKAAYDKWHNLESSSAPIVSTGSVVEILDLFLEWVEKNRPASYEWYGDRINAFAKTISDLPFSKLKVHHVQAWIDTKKSDGHKRGCVTAVNRALNWAQKQEYIARNPLRGMEKPSAGRRDVIVPPEIYEKMLSAASDEAFRDLLLFTWETGARPQETVALEARHLDLPGARCIFPEKESKGKKRQRVIYLNEKALEIIARRAKSYPEGPLFRNADGGRWKRNNIACRFGRMQTKVGKKYCLYNLRHSWMTSLLKAGVDPITVATLAGHTDTSMLARIYSHIQNDTEHLRKALDKLRGGCASSGSEPSLAPPPPA